MNIIASLNEAKGAVLAITAIGAGALGLDARHAKHDDVVSLKADSRVATIFNLKDQAQRDGASQWLCRAIEEQFVALCTEAPDHYLCDPEAKQDILTSAGCR